MIVKVPSDGWTAVTRDRSLSAQFEHVVASPTRAWRFSRGRRAACTSRRITEPVVPAKAGTRAHRATKLGEVCGYGFPLARERPTARRLIIVAEPFAAVARCCRDGDRCP